MSRAINIHFRRESDGSDTRIEVRNPYYLLGGQRSSMEFWNLPKLREIGITRLAELGVTDPVYFVGWDMMADLRREILLLQEHFASIEYHAETKAEWLSHLVFCYYLLIQTAPKESIPVFMIG